MLFKLNSDIEGTADQDDVIALDSLLRSAFFGCHLVLADRRTVEWILSNLDGQISPQALAYLNRLSNNLSQIGGIEDKFSVLAIVKRSVDNISSLGTTRWEIPLRAFRSDSLSSKSVLLVENLTDSKIYSEAAQHYQTFEKLTGILHGNFEPRLGGGSTTSTVFDQLLSESSRLTLCVVDSDKCFPTSALGNTARNCEVVYGLHGQNNVCHLHILEERELENLVPVSLIRDAYSPADFDSTALVSLAADTETQNAHKYGDLKNGTCIGWVQNSLSEKPEEYEFWDSMINHMSVAGRVGCRDAEEGACGSTCNGMADCNWVIVQKCPQDLLTKVLELPKSIHKKIEIETKDYNYGSWMSVGKTVFEFSAAFKPIRI